MSVGAYELPVPGPVHIQNHLSKTAKNGNSLHKRENKNYTLTPTIYISLYTQILHL